MSTNKNGAGDQYTIRSVSRAIGILEILGSRAGIDGMSVTEIADAAGMSKSAAFSVLQTFRSHGFVSDIGTGQNRRYRLGAALARLGEHARGQLPVRDLARPVLRRLASETGLPARLGVRDGNEVMTVEDADAAVSVQIALQMGQRESLHSTGLGKAMLAQLPDEEVVRVLEEAGMPPKTPYTITSIDEMLLQLERVRRAGYAVDDEEGAESIFCIGSAVLDQRGNCVGAISVTSLKTRASIQKYPEIGASVREAAREISSALGWKEEPAPAVPA